jgi:hypothetical protein
VARAPEGNQKKRVEHGHDHQHLELENLLTGRRITAECYLQAAALYNLELGQLGETIPLLELGRLPEGERLKAIRTQLTSVLEKNPQSWDWSLIEAKDAASASSSPSPSSSHHDIRKEPRRRFLRDLLADRIRDKSAGTVGGKNLREKWGREWEACRPKERDQETKKWAAKLLRTTTGWPLAKELEEEVECFESPMNGTEVWEKAFEANEAALQWKKESKTTPPRRLAEIRAQGPEWADFDPHLAKWQKVLLKEFEARGISLEAGIKGATPPPPPSLWAPKEADLWVVGERHGAEGNFTQLEKILEEGRKHGFEVLSLEEPEDTSWKPWAEFAASLGPKQRPVGNALLEKAREFCRERLSQNQSHQNQTHGGKPNPKPGIEKTAASLGEKLALIHRGRSLGYKVTFSDLPAAEKMKRSADRKETAIKAIINAPPTNPKDPISALGGPEVWADSIREVYTDCRLRSQHMTKKLCGDKAKTIHVGGLLHCMDIARESAALGRNPSVWWLEKMGASPVIAALGQEPKPGKGISLPRKKSPGTEMEIQP